MTKKFERIPCEFCGKEIPSAGIGFEKHMKTHEKDKLLALLREEFKALREEQAQVRDMRAEAKAEAARQEQKIRESLSFKAGRMKAMYEQEEKVNYTAGDEGFEMTVNHYRVYIPPNTVGKIPKSWLQILEQRLAIKKRNAALMQAVKQNPDGDMKTYGQMQGIINAAIGGK